jgi:hypothetical protein
MLRNVLFGQRQVYTVIEIGYKLMIDVKGDFTNAIN